MADIGTFTPEQARALWQWYQRSGGTPSPMPRTGPRPLGHQEDMAVILDEALAAASDSKTGATSGLATVCVWDVELEDFVETTEQVTVWNHSESTSHDADTFGIARWIASHLWFFGDCAAMAAR